jgi:hypothetical protein
MSKILKIGNYQKVKCYTCGEYHLCVSVFEGIDICNSCMQEFTKYRNIANNMRRTTPHIKKESAEALRIVK